MLAFFAILSMTSSMARAETELEQCSYTLSKELIQIVKDTVGLHSRGQLESIGLLVGNKCKSTNTNEDKEIIQSAVDRAAREVLGENLTFDSTWQSKALQAINDELKRTYGERLQSTAQLNLKADEANQQFTGTISMADGYTCHVLSQYRANQGKLSLSCLQTR